MVKRVRTTIKHARLVTVRVKDTLVIVVLVATDNQLVKSKLGQTIIGAVRAALQ